VKISNSEDFLLLIGHSVSIRLLRGLIDLT
jgi:hypothetical protein